MSDWVKIEEFPQYSVNPEGEVRHDRLDRYVKPQMNRTNNVYVGLIGSDGRQHQRSLALLVAKIFVPKDMYTFDTPINLNGNRWDCSADNLMWRPRWFAIRYHQELAHRYDHIHQPNPVLELNTNVEYRDTWDVCIEFGLIHSSLVEAIQHQTYVWPTYQMFVWMD